MYKGKLLAVGALAVLAVIVPVAAVDASESGAVEPPPTAEPPDTAPATQTDDDLGVVVEAGLRGYRDLGEYVPVRVSITADQLFDGRVEVRTSSASPAITRDVQVPGGTTKSVLLVAPTSFSDENVEVRLVDGGSVVTTKRVSMKSASEVELVGLMPQLFARAGEVPDQVNLDNDTGRAELIPIDEDLLALAPLSLDAFDSIVASGADLAALSSGQLTGLMTWVGEGGRLLLDDDSAMSLLPEAWRPGDAGYSLASMGEVHLLEGRASKGEFRSFIEPSADLPSGSLNQGAEMMVSPQTELATRAGVKLPSLGPLLIGLALYALLIGPIAYFLLRRARRVTAAWIVLPVTAVLTTAVVILAGDSFRSTGSPASATFVQSSPGGASAMSNLLIFSRSGGGVTVSAPARWGADTSGLSWFGFDQSVSGSTTIRQTDSSTDAVAQLDPGQVITTVLTGPTIAEPLTTTARVQDDILVGTVTNSTPYVLHDVAVFSSSGAESLDTLEPGSSKEWSMRAPTRPEPFGSHSTDVWGNPDVGIGFQRSELAEFGIWGLADFRYGLYPEGTVRVAGWTDERPSDADAGPRSSDRTVISSIEPIEAGDGPLHQSSVRAQTVRSPFGQFGNGFGDIVMRYLLPPDSPEQDLVLDAVQIGGADTAVELWDGAAWKKVDVESGNEVAVPRSAVVDGVVLVRIKTDPNFGFDTSNMPYLVGAEEAEG